MNRDKLKNCSVIRMVIEVHSMKRELSKSLIVFMYIEDQLKFGQTILTSTWWFDLTSLLSLLM